MNACPICEVEVAKIKLLAHVWQHLPLQPGAVAFSDASTRRTPAQDRLCWCGQRYYAFVFWQVHMEGKDVQAHYAASLLGISR